MNGSYTTILVRNASGVSAIAESLGGLSLASFVVEDALTGDAVVYPETITSAPHAADLVAATLAAHFPTAVVLLAEVEEGEVLCLRLWQKGVRIGEYVPEPGYDSGEEMAPSGNADTFSEAFGITNRETQQELRDVFGAGRYDDIHGFNDAEERHRDIAELLGLSLASVGTGYDDLVHGVLPEDIPSASAVHPVAASEGATLQEFVVFAASSGTSEADVAARFLPQVISFEEDFLDEETPGLGDGEQVEQRFRDAGWNHRVGAELLEYQLESGTRLIAETPIGSVADSCPAASVWGIGSDDNLAAAWDCLCRAHGWGVWSYRTRRVVYPPAA